MRPDAFNPQRVDVESITQSQALYVRTGSGILGETFVHQVERPVYITGAYGIQDDVIETFDATGGAVGVNSNRHISLTTGTSVGGYGVARSQRQLRWRPGETVGFYAAGYWPTPGVANSTLRIGTTSLSSAYFVGYEGTTFGLHAQSAGGGEIRVLTVGTGASGGENATITLNGVEFAVALTAGTATFNAAQIAAQAGWTAGGWNATQVGSTVVFDARTSGARSGSYSMSSATAAGTFTQMLAGEANAVTSYAQADWNADRCDGTGASGFNLDPSKLNIYRVLFTWESAELAIKNPTTGAFVIAHRAASVNAQEVPLVTDPVMQIGAVAASLGSTTSLETVCAWISGTSSGDYLPTRNPRAASVEKTSIATGSEKPLISIRNATTFGGYLNQRVIEPKRVTVYNGAAKDATVRIRLGATLTGAQWAAVDDNSPANTETVATAASGGTEVDAFVVTAGTTSPPVDLDRLGIVLDRGETLTVSIEVSSGSAYNSTASISWQDRA